MTQEDITRGIKINSQLLTVSKKKVQTTLPHC